MKSRVVAAVDQGTTSSRCLLFNREGEAVSAHQLEHQQIYPRPGWVEHDAEEIWESQLSVARRQYRVFCGERGLKEIPPDEPAAAGKEYPLFICHS